MWNSYPYLPPRLTFEDIRLDPGNFGGGLWYTSGIESFISTMETSSLMGMNVAKLVVDHWDKEQYEMAEHLLFKNEETVTGGS